MTGRDITQEDRGLFAIDLFGLSSDDLRTRHPVIYQWLLDRVKPERDQNARTALRERWWIFGEARSTFRPALGGCERAIATSLTAKHRTFIFVPANAVCDSTTVMFALQEGIHLGVLSSELHMKWAEAAGGTLEDRPRYIKTVCFETFPFPDEDTGLTLQLRERIATLAEHIDAHRKRVLAQDSFPRWGKAGMGADGADMALDGVQAPTPTLPQKGREQDERLPQRGKEEKLTLTALYNVLAALREGRALSPKEKAIHTQGLVGVLRELHDELDAAVLAAYGLRADASTDDILAHLVQLNTQRAAEEAQGHVRWLRPAFQNPQRQLQKQELLVPENQALQGDLVEEAPAAAAAAKPAQQPWPATLPEQVRAVAEVLARSAVPLGVPAIEACFKGRGPWKKGLPTLLQTLEALGRARMVASADGVLWRG